MALWGNKDLVYGDGTITIDVSAGTLTGSGTTFTTAGITTGNVVTVGAGASQGYILVTSVNSNTVLGVGTSKHLVNGYNDIPAGATYQISQEPISFLEDSHYDAPESKTTGFSTSPVFTGVFGVDNTEIGVARTATGDAGKYAPAHAGWVGITSYIDQHGNLRVKSEVLVAMGKDAGGNGGIQADASDDTLYPDTAS